MACNSNPPAPVIDRAPAPPKSPPEKTVTPTIKPASDWRPDTYAVKKGDTLFSIGLEFGYDYKDIALANNIAPPYPIKIGQLLNFTSLKTKEKMATKPEVKPEDGVIVSPIKVEPDVTENKTATIQTLSQPKAMREAYSKDNLNKPIASKPAETVATAQNPNATKPIIDDESIAWAWPTKGKTIANFNEVSNKGINIAGSMGQAINAAGAGKVIYSGSDLRGYGKLVIIKHNKTYLSVYAHNSKLLVKEGQSVTAGQKIAEMGNTDSNSVNLHFEIRKQGKSVDPVGYLSQN
jgi:lipoprotein NlpD